LCILTAFGAGILKRITPVCGIRQSLAKSDLRSFKSDFQIARAATPKCTSIENLSRLGNPKSGISPCINHPCRFSAGADS
jgi:hypothetical protein